ncbi:hypothetical protein FM106_26130 [Brachybacterium faecium]|nr:hypothetical protein FM106_26130 [Brachybacterium faecium]
MVRSVVRGGAGSVQAARGRGRPPKGIPWNSFPCCSSSP